jgi:DNA-binding beta-propeller fold protein YncE
MLKNLLKIFLFSLALISSPVFAAGKATVFVSFSKGFITMYQMDDMSKIADIEVGEGARGMGISDDGKTLAVAIKSAGELLLIDVDSRKITKRIAVGKNPEFVRVLNDKAFVAYEPSNQMAAPGADASQQKKKAKADDDDATPARVSVVELKTGKKSADIEAGMETEGIEFSADGQLLLVTNESDENVSVHDIATGKLVKKIDTKKHGLRPRGIKRSPDGNTFAVTLELSDKLVIINKSLEVQDVISTGNVPYGVTFNAAGTEIYVALAKAKAVQVFDAKSYAVKRQINVAERCWHFTLNQDESKLIAACGRSNNLVVADTQTGKILQDVPAPGTPWGIITYPRSTGSLDFKK